MRALIKELTVLAYVAVAYWIAFYVFLETQQWAITFAEVHFYNGLCKFGQPIKEGYAFCRGLNYDIARVQAAIHGALQLAIVGLGAVAISYALARRHGTKLYVSSVLVLGYLACLQGAHAWLDIKTLVSFSRAVPIVLIPLLCIAVATVGVWQHNNSLQARRP